DPYNVVIIFHDPPETLLVFPQHLFGKARAGDAICCPDRTGSLPQEQPGNKTEADDSRTSMSEQKFGSTSGNLGRLPHRLRERLLNVRVIVRRQKIWVQGTHYFVAVITGERNVVWIEQHERALGVQRCSIHTTIRSPVMTATK